MALILKAQASSWFKGLMQEEIFFAHQVTDDALLCIEEKDANELCTWLSDVQKFFDTLQHITNAGGAMNLLLRSQESNWYTDLLIVSVAVQREGAIAARHKIVFDARKLFGVA